MNPIISNSNGTITRANANQASATEMSLTDGEFSLGSTFAFGKNLTNESLEICTADEIAVRIKR